MNNFLIICTSLVFLSIAHGQTIQYVTRIRNFSIESETDTAHLISFNIFQDKHEQRISGAVNFTKDLRMKNIEVTIYRCSYEKSDCENFQKWKFTRDLNKIVYMKNQMWTPLFDRITPRLDIPFIKKNIYYSRGGNVDASVFAAFYPEVVNHFWRADVIASDYNDKKAFVMKPEFAIISFVKRDNPRIKHGTRRNRTTKKQDETTVKF